jgi:four helix bundle protein
VNDEWRMTNDQGMTKHQAVGNSDDSFWACTKTSIVREESDAKPIYDLEERTARFGETVIDFAKKIPAGPLTDRIVNQLVGAGTSVGANYDEADDAVSKKEFLKCIGACKKEARETKHVFENGGWRGSRIEVRGARPVARSQNPAPDVRGDFEERKTEMTNRETGIFRHSSFVSTSSFVVRHSSF